ncbi:MAG TPA: DMT family transporter [Kofleriaceae bacterium]|jgi:transporter family-2 protein|nr:DMT family transporter [Kofleriaceae bacterium]HMG55892.1 DMT family transporter [Kofleriaceae bacterium]
MFLPLALTVAVGSLVTIHIAMNARIGTITGNGNLANSVFWLVGFAASLAITRGYEPGFLARIGSARTWLLLAGAIGAFIAAFNNAMIPRIGIANLTFCLFLGQVVASALLATTGILSDGRDPLTPVRTTGILLVVAGTSLFAYGDRIVRS